MDMDFEAARVKGINVCIDALGRDFVMAHAKNSCSSYGRQADEQTGEEFADCFVGVAESIPPMPTGKLILTNGEKWPYYSRCHVFLTNGAVKMVETVAPSGR